MRSGGYVVLVLAAVVMGVTVFERRGLRSRLRHFLLASAGPPPVGAAASASASAAASRLLARRVPMDEASRVITYAQVYEELYRPLGYSLRTDEAANESYPFLPLSLPRLSCPQVFANWLAHNAKNATNKPPKWDEISAEEQALFLMKGFGGLGPYYRGVDAKNADSKKANILSPEKLHVYTDRLRARNYGNLGYGHEGASMYHAMAGHRPGPRGMTVGTIKFWVEAIARFVGVDHITIAEYQTINIDPQVQGVSWVHPLDIAADVGKFGDLDWVASFSSLEHSGLGRYGDIVDPIGDLREAHKIHCLLKPGGLFFLGLPTGSTDGVAWNAHRIYSLVRWPLMGAGFRVLGIHKWNKAAPVSFSSVVGSPGLRRLRSFHQVTAVLQKIQS